MFSQVTHHRMRMMVAAGLAALPVALGCQSAPQRPPVGPPVVTTPDDRPAPTASVPPPSTTVPVPSTPQPTAPQQPLETVTTPGPIPASFLDELAAQALTALATELPKSNAFAGNPKKIAMTIEAEDENSNGLASMVRSKLINDAETRDRVVILATGPKTATGQQPGVATEEQLKDLGIGAGGGIRPELIHSLRAKLVSKSAAGGAVHQYAVSIHVEKSRDRAAVWSDTFSRTIVWDGAAGKWRDQ